MELIVCAKFTDLPKIDMWGYSTKFKLEEVIERHMKQGRKKPERVWQWGGVFYLDASPAVAEAKNGQ